MISESVFGGDVHLKFFRPFGKRFYRSSSLCINIIITTVIFSAGICQNVYSQTPVLWGKLENGNYKAGFKYIEKYDNARWIDSSGSSRPIQISVWYPAEKIIDSKRLQYRDYIALTSHEIDFSNCSDSSLNNTVDNYANLLSARGIPIEAVEKFMNSEMNAYLNPEAADGKFPLIIVGQGNYHPSANLSILCEFLATHGYCVATSASPTRITGQLKDSTEIYKYALDQRDDMKFIYDELKNDLDINEVGVIGYSFGGRGGFLLLNDFEFVKAFVSLDSGIANKIGRHWLDGIEINIDKIRSPILHIYQDVESFVVPDFSLIDSLTCADRYLLKIENMRHGFFFNLGMAIGVIPEFDFPNTDKDSTRIKFETVCKTTLGFFDEYIKNENDIYWDNYLKGVNVDSTFTKFKILKKQN